MDRDRAVSNGQPHPFGTPTRFDPRRQRVVLTRDDDPAAARGHLVSHPIDALIPESPTQYCPTGHEVAHVPTANPEISIDSGVKPSRWARPSALVQRIHFARLQPLGQYLARNTPKRVRPPGVLSAYSNYGTALAGYIVERVAQKPFAHYMADHIFAPLQMRRSSFEQPLPPALQADLTASYTFENGAYRQVPPKYIRMPSAGASVATVTDMANFMIAHLGNVRILAEATAIRMHGRLWSQDPRVNGFAHGFAESTVNGQRILRHEGEVPGNGCSALMLLPEHRLGLYVAYNGMCDMTTGTRLWHAFLDRYYPAPATTLSQSTGTRADVEALAGSYRSTRRSFTSFSKAGSLISFPHLCQILSCRLWSHSGRSHEIRPFIGNPISGANDRSLGNT